MEILEESTDLYLNAVPVYMYFVTFHPSLYEKAHFLIDACVIALETHLYMASYLSQ